MCLSPHTATCVGLLRQQAVYMQCSRHCWGCPQLHCWGCSQQCSLELHCWSCPQLHCWGCSQQCSLALQPSDAVAAPPLVQCVLQYCALVLLYKCTVIYVSPYYHICVLRVGGRMLLHMCPHTTICVSAGVGGVLCYKNLRLNSSSFR